MNSVAKQATLLVIISLTFSLVLAEIGLRALESAGIAPTFFESLGKASPPMDKRDGAGMYYTHPYSGYNHKPGFQKGNFERINNVGFRGEDIVVDKPDDVYRIAAIGGSTTFAVYLPWNETYPYFLQKVLNKRLQPAAKQIEVMNAGMSGSTTAESLHRLFYQVLPTKPDMVVIYHAYNDLFPRVFDNFQDDYFHFRKVDPYYPPGLTRFLTYRLALKVLNPIAFNENYNLMNRIWKTENFPESDAKRLQNFLDTSESAFEKNLEDMVKVLIGNGVQPVLATFANKRDMLHWNDYIPPYAWEEGINQNNRAIRRVAEKYNVPLVPFAEQAADLPQITIWQKKGLRESCCYSDSIHMSTPGNVVKAEIFADTIEPIIRESLQAAP